MKELSERKIQSAFFQEFKLYGFDKFLLAQAVKNEVGKNNIITGRLNKLAGVVAGASDVVIFDMRTLSMRKNSTDYFKPLFLEFKTSKGRQSPSQKDYQARVEEGTHTYYIVRSSEEAINRVKDYFGL